MSNCLAGNTVACAARSPHLDCAGMHMVSVSGENDSLRSCFRCHSSSISLGRPSRDPPSADVCLWSEFAVEHFGVHV